MVSRGPGHGLHFRTDWVVILVVQLCLVGCSADYFWDGTEWVWKDSPGDLAAAAEGSGDGGHAGLYNHDDEDDEGSGDQQQKEDDYHDHLVHEMDTEVLDDSDTVSVDDEIDPRDLDIGFHEDITSGPDKAAPQTTPSIVPRDPQGDDPTKYLNQDTNFFSQPGILTAVIGGTVVGLLCTILLVMFIVYRMRKADEGSYSLNEPKRSPNVHSYLKAPSREFFA